MLILVSMKKMKIIVIMIILLMIGILAIQSLGKAQAKEEKLSQETELATEENIETTKAVYSVETEPEENTVEPEENQTSLEVATTEEESSRPTRSPLKNGLLLL